MKPLFTLFLCLTIVLLVGCKKDKYTPLKGELDKFIGTWDWIESEGPCGMKYPYGCYSSPSTEGYSIQLTFYEDGEYEKLRDNEVVESGGVSIVNRSGPYWEHNMLFLHKKEEDFNAVVFSDIDTLVLSNYPFDYDGENIFVRR